MIFFELAATKRGLDRHRAAVRPPGQAARVQRLAQRPRPLDAEVSRTACSTAAAAPTTVMRSTPRSRAIEALQAQGLPHPRCVGLIETCEESGSYDLPAYLDALRPRLGKVGLVVCLDSGAGNYDQLWLTTSLRGMVSGVLKVEILTEGIHSGDASGLVPSSFRILRQVLDRLEDSKTGELLPESFHCELPGLAPRAGAGHRGDPGRRGLEAHPLGLRRRRRADAADHHRPGRGPAEPHLAAHAQRHRRRRLPGAAATPATCCAPTPPSSSACACRRWSTATRPACGSRPCSRTTRPTTPRSPSTPTAAPARSAPPAGTRPNWRPGWRRR